MPKLILIRHSNSKPEPGKSPHTWDVSEDGRRRAGLLADALVRLRPASLHSSEEPKAMSTAQIVAAKMQLVVNRDPRFNEQERSREPWTDAAEFKKAVKSALRRPSQLVYGSETVAAAVERFSAGVRNAEENRPPGDMAIVSHGTVIAGFVAARAGVDAVEVWESLGMPGLVVINWPEAVGVEQVRNFKE